MKVKLKQICTYEITMPDGTTHTGFDLVEEWQNMLLYKDRLDSELILDKAGIQLEDGTVEVEVIKLSPSLNPTKKR